MKGGHTFQGRGVKLWNVIPLEVGRKDTVSAFQIALKKGHPKILMYTLISLF